MGRSRGIGYWIFIATSNRIDATKRHHMCYDASLDIVRSKEYPAFGTGATAPKTLLDFGVKVVGIRRIDDLDPQS